MPSTISSTSMIASFNNSLPMKFFLFYLQRSSSVSPLCRRFSRFDPGARPGENGRTEEEKGAC